MSNNPTKTFVSINSLSSHDRQLLRNAIMEINDSMLRVSSERDLQKEALDSITDKLGVDKKIVRRMARTYYKANFNAEVEDNNTFEEFYQTVINGSTNG